MRYLLRLLRKSLDIFSRRADTDVTTRYCAVLVVFIGNVGQLSDRSTN